MPNTKGTQNTPIRFTPEDKAKVRIIQERQGLPSFAAAVRYAVNYCSLIDNRLIALLEKIERKSGKSSKEP